MALITESIRNLLNGVSQQPASVRDPSQHQEQINFDSNFISGLTSRPPFEFFSEFGSGYLITGGSYHVIDRGDGDRWMLCLTGQGVSVISLDTGSSAFTSYDTLMGGVTPDYLKSFSKRSDIKVLTVADKTFIVNSSITVETDEFAPSPATILTVASFADLPPDSAGANYVYKIHGSTGDSGRYYVKQNPVDKTWTEVRSSNYEVPKRFYLPIQMVRDGANSFKFEYPEWSFSDIGDNTTSPLISFANTQIKDLFFYRNRLGVLTADSICLSRAGDYFNFSPRTTTQVFDDDHIDVSIAHPRVTELAHAIPFNGALMLFGKEAQFQLTGGDVLTPRSIRIDPVTSYSMNTDVRPVSIGPNVYFAQDNSKHSRLREYYVENESITNNALDITAHCPRYIPSGIADLAASSTEDVLVCMAPSEKDTLFVYRTKWADRGTKAQSSWSKWTLPHIEGDPNSHILAIEVSGSRIYVILKVAGQVSIYVADLDSTSSYIQATGGGDVVPTLDWMTRVTPTTWDEANNRTVIDTFVPLNVGTEIHVMDTQTGSTTKVTTITGLGSRSVPLPGDWRGRELLVGIPYTCELTMSELFPRDREGAAVTAGRLQLRHIRAMVRNSYGCVAEIVKRGKAAITRTWEAPANADILLSQLSLSSEPVHFAIQNHSKGTTVKLKNLVPYPVAIESIEWTGLYASRGRVK